ncbi:hypothetical protein [Zunongwangia sp. HGR-M22]|uniref:hypothetical protein n=1 Tax=Zunongwangia sp. HGR-M22 TaxID=3015168 RepID=UPI0022DD0849|nr:hypothetical protein [Zunongwangia sp. HGR-M22]WBL27009.1 hypothetical protein PBT91_06995 [Zunongwangia sp. HGR-M22]
MLIKQLKNILFFSLFCYSSLSNAQDEDFVGTYTHSEMELAEQIHILDSYRFSWQQVYGARNIDLRGKWVVKEDTLVITLDPLPNDKNPGPLEAVLTSSGNLSLIKFAGKSAPKEIIYRRATRNLSEEMAKELAKPIDYSKVIAAQKDQLKRQQEKEQKLMQKIIKQRKEYGKYNGFFKNDDPDFPVMLGLNAKRKQFILSKPATEKGAVNYFQGTFTVKNDTAYATTSAAHDEIKLYGSSSETIADDELVIYFRKLDLKNLQVKSGENFEEANFISSKKFKTENDSVQYVQLQKGDRLWVRIGKKEAHIYSFSLQDSNYNQLLLQPNYAHVETWVEKPIYITDEDEINSLYDGKITLKLSTPERVHPPLGMMPSTPRFNGNRYFSIDREQLFKLQKD